MNKIHHTLVIISLAATLAVSNVVLAQPNFSTSPITPVTKAIAVLAPTQGNSASGIITFSQVGNGVKIIANISGLSPGTHGFHIHEFGDCSAPDALSAGGHFNPFHMPHAEPDTQLRHAGDLGNLTVDSSGKAHYERIDQTIVLDGPASVIGHSVIVHVNADDFKSQPAGNAGPRAACGVIGVAKP